MSLPIALNNAASKLAATSSPHRVAVETLEARRLMSVNLASNGVLTLDLSNKTNNHTISFGINPSNPAQYLLQNNARMFPFAVGTVDDIQIFGAQGHNTVTVDPSLPERVQANGIKGGNAGDTVFGSAGKDIIQLGSGANFVDTRSGSDNVQGGGNDTLLGGSGRDTLFASESGACLLVGGSGASQLIGGDMAASRDTIVTGSGADQVNTGQGNSIVFGGSGNCSMAAGAGNDTLYAGTGNTTIRGGSGHELIVAASKRGANHITRVGNTLPPSDGGNDSITGGTGGGFIVAGAGLDTIKSGSFVDPANAPNTIYFANPSDSLLSTAADVIPSTRTFDPNQTLTGDVTVHLTLQRKRADGSIVAFQIPANTGTFSGGVNSIAEAVDANGSIRFRSNTATTFTLGEFFAQSGIRFNRRNLAQFHGITGRTFSMTVNGVNNDLFRAYQVQQGDNIVIEVS